MDLSKMQDKCRRSDYENLNMFLDDWKLMIKNCHDYNRDRNPHLIPVVEKLFDQLKEELQTVLFIFLFFIIIFYYYFSIYLFIFI